jgi:hypothetical protein
MQFGVQMGGQGATGGQLGGDSAGSGRGKALGFIQGGQRPGDRRDLPRPRPVSPAQRQRGPRTWRVGAAARRAVTRTGSGSHPTAAVSLPAPWERSQDSPAAQAPRRARDAVWPARQLLLPDSPGDARWCQYVCPLIPKSAAAVGHEQLTVSTVPLLAFNGAYDPVEQPRNWSGAQVFYRGSRDITLPGQGHDTSPSWYLCAGPLAQAFIEQASVAHLNTGCLASAPARRSTWPWAPGPSTTGRGCAAVGWVTCSRTCRISPATTSGSRRRRRCWLR